MKDKKFLLKLLILLFISVFSIVFVYNDYFLYKRPILKIDKIKEKVDDS